MEETEKPHAWERKQIPFYPYACLSYLRGTIPTGKTLHHFQSVIIGIMTSDTKQIQCSPFYAHPHLMDDITSKFQDCKLMNSHGGVQVQCTQELLLCG